MRTTWGLKPVIVVVGLRGKKHPALLGVVTTHEVKKSRIHLKMQVGDYRTYQTPLLGLSRKITKKLKFKPYTD